MLQPQHNTGLMFSGLQLLLHQTPTTAPCVMSHAFYFLLPNVMNLNVSKSQMCQGGDRSQGKACISATQVCGHEKSGRWAISG